ncbi:PIN domain-containing protein [Kribbella sp. CA-294648]|uniref:PIN domain-containing protein n=1 Tax=Kribbella sp. CA-294648 TaxID=3239948 RepID=UPI003D8BDCE5
MPELSMLKLVPGMHREALLRQLREAHAGLLNSRNGGDTVVTQHRAYLDWANTSASILRAYLQTPELDRLIFTRRYWVLQSNPIETIDPNGRMLWLEISEREAVFETEVAQLAHTIERWGGSERFVIADTNVFIHHEQRLEVLDLGTVIGETLQPLHLIVPLPVVDELDDLKHAGKGQIRGRARYTLAVLDRVLRNGFSGTLHEDRKFGGHSGKVTVEIVLDPPGHVRLPIMDEEILDRAKAIQALAGPRPVHFLTFDTGHSTRARRTGLRVQKLTEPLDDSQQAQS